MTILDDAPRVDGYDSTDVVVLIREARQRQRRRWGIRIFLILLVAALAATGLVNASGGGSSSTVRHGTHPSMGTAEPSQTGIATGTAVACTGLMALPTADLSVFKGARLVRHETVTTGDTFRFRLPPGRYVISNDGSPYDQGHPPGGPFLIGTGRISHVVVRDYCM